MVPPRAVHDETVRSRWRRWRRPLAFLGAVLIVANLAPSASASDAAYVGTQTCATCHTAETEAWRPSHHALAWTMPGPDTVLADFASSTFEHDGMRAIFTREGEDYVATVTEADGETTRYTLHSVAGVAPLQQYLFMTEPGRVQSFDVAWDVVRGAWYHLYPDQHLPPDNGMHWTGPYKNWNARCAECHATGYQKALDPATLLYNSTQAEIGVGCEACHGPGSNHVALAEGGGGEAPPGWGFPLAFGGPDPEVEIQQCAGCHSRREAIEDGNPQPGTPYHDAYRLSLLTPGLYHRDGQILDEVYVYGSFLQSKMYAEGVRCSDCHDPHSATLKAEGNAVCTQCHSPAGNTRFPSLTLAAYDDPAHHHHDPGTEGAACVSCHMPERTYMGIDPRRDHSLRVPRPDLGPVTGAPDACTTCHSGETQGWAAAHIADWFPDPAHRGPHYGEVFAAWPDPGAVDGLAGLVADPEQPAIVRATALSMLSYQPTPELAARLAAYLADEEPLVRAAAAAPQRAARGPVRAEQLGDLLTDPMRSVRFAAARELLTVPPEDVPAALRADLQQAVEDWQASLVTRFDFPETHLVLGGVALGLRNPEAATAAFRRAVSLDPQRVDAWVMLGRIAMATGGPHAAMPVLRDALHFNPDDAQLRGFAGTLGMPLQPR